VTELLYARQITKAEFDELCGEHRSSIPVGSSEVAWFVSTSREFVATILNHQHDRYWGALVIDATGGHCCAIQVDVALRSVSTAEHMIDAAFGVLERDGGASPQVGNATGRYQQRHCQQTSPNSEQSCGS
jgi:hypothetical protein